MGTYVNKVSGGDVIVLTVSGVLDTGAATTLASELSSEIGSAVKVVADFSGMEHLTSAGAGAIMSIRNTLNEKGGDLRLASLPEKISKVFKVLHLDKVVQIHPSVDSAKASF